MIEYFQASEEAKTAWWEFKTYYTKYVDLATPSVSSFIAGYNAALGTEREEPTRKVELKNEGKSTSKDAGPTLQEG